MLMLFVFLSACLLVCVCAYMHACIHALYLTSVHCSSGLSMAICHHRNAFNGPVFMYRITVVKYVFCLQDYRSVKSVTYIYIS